MCVSNDSVYAFRLRFGFDVFSILLLLLLHIFCGFMATQGAAHRRRPDTTTYADNVISTF